MRTWGPVDFAVLGHYIVTEILRGNWKTVEHESDGNTNCNWRVHHGHQKIGTGTRVLGNKKTNGDHSNWDRPEYWEESWRLEKTCWHSDSSGKLSAYAGVKNSQISKISVRRSDQLVVSDKKENLHNSWLCRPSRPRGKLKESKMIDKHLDLASKVKSQSNTKKTLIQIVILAREKKLKPTGTSRLGNKGTSGYHLNYIISKIDQNTGKSPGDLRKLAVTQTPVKYH